MNILILQIGIEPDFEREINFSRNAFLTCTLSISTKMNITKYGYSMVK